MSWLLQLHLPTTLRRLKSYLTWDVNFHDFSGINNSMESIFEAAGKRIVIVDIGCWSSSVIAYWWNFDEMAGLIDTIPTKFVR